MSASKRHPSDGRFASHFVYCPPWTGDEGGEHNVKSRRLVDSIKKETRQAFGRWSIAERVRDDLPPTIKAEFLGPEATLVPVPGHAPLRGDFAHWSARDICREFVRVGLGQNWLPLVARGHRVTKSAFARPEDRPTFDDHFASFTASSRMDVGQVITVVDDVITRGATMLAALERLRDVYPDRTVVGFALIRTMWRSNLEAVIDPAQGGIRFWDGKTSRNP